MATSNRRHPMGNHSKDERVPLFYRFIRWLMVRKLGQNLEQVYIQNLEQVQHLLIEQSVIIAPNHVCYWDSCMYFLLSGLLGPRAFVLVAQQTLRRLPFLRWCGSIPLNTDSKEQAIAQLKGLSNLNTESTQFWIFPQGEHRPTQCMPLKCKKGVLLLAQDLKIPIVPMSIQYLYRNSEQPVAYISFQSSLSHTVGLSELEQSLKQGLDASIQHHLGEETLSFVPYFPGIQASRDDLPTRILAWFSGMILGDVSKN